MSVLARLKVPVFTAGGFPDIDEKNYDLTVCGLDGGDKIFRLDELAGLPQSTVNARLTSVSGWSVRADWQGVLWSDFMAVVGSPASSAVCAVFVSYGDGYRTPVRLADLDHPRILLATHVNDEPIEIDYGGPLRMVIPNLYGYKSAKWLTRIEFQDEMTGGYWEDRGYSRTGEIEPGMTHDVNSGERRPISGGEVTEF